MSKQVFITGGTGFIGHRLCRVLNQQGYEVTVFSRRTADEVHALCGPVRTVDRLSALPGLGRLDAVINLAGEGIAEKRWTQARKAALWQSRVDLTEELCQHIRRCQEPPGVLVSGSAVGYYGDQGAQAVTEDTAPQDEFTHQMCAAWEQAALSVSDQTRVCLSRTGLVVGSNGGFLEKMRLPFLMGVGGRLGSGQQYMPWIHRTDMINGLLFLLENTEASGPYNLTAPNPATNAQFTKTLGRVLGRPTVLPAPGFALKAGLGEMARLLLTGQNAIPQRLLDEGFQFQFPELEPALQDAMKNWE